MQQLILKKENEFYFSKGMRTNGLSLLEDFLTSDVGKGKNKYLLEMIKNPEIRDMNFNLCEYEKIGDSLYLNYELCPCDTALVIKVENFISIVEKWMELTEAKVEKIILTEEDDGSFTIKEG